MKAKKKARSLLAPTKRMEGEILIAQFAERLDRLWSILPAPFDCSAIRRRWVSLVPLVYCCLRRKKRVPLVLRCTTMLASICVCASDTGTQVGVVSEVVASSTTLGD